MSNLIIYQEDKSELPELAFVKDVPNQIKIRDIKDSYELTKEFGKLWPIVITAMGIKGELDQFTKTDIRKMILMRFKGLSLNEIDYAFRLERYGILGERIQHFQLFDAGYVGRVLDKYVEWKRQVKIEHKIDNLLEERKVSEEDVRKYVNSAVKKAWDHFTETLTLKEGYWFIYDELMKSGFLNNDLEFKKQIHKDAIEALEIEYTNKEATDIVERKKYNQILETLKSFPKQPIVVLKCKELSIISFFRGVRKDKKLYKEFKTKYEL